METIISSSTLSSVSSSISISVLVPTPYLYGMILITGSTGLVGRHLLLALTLEGKNVRALYRSDNKKRDVEEYFAFAKAENLLKYISWAKGDINDLPYLCENFKDITHVYHCAALISFNPYDFKKLTKVNIEGTANVVNLCLSENIRKLVYLSSIATLADLPNNPITEENYWDPDADNSVYGLTKYGAEMEVWRATQEGLNAVIFNPGIILGEGNYHSGSGTVFDHILKEKSFYPTGATAVIDVKDLVFLMIKGMEMKLSEERYITIGHNIFYKDLFTQIAQSLEKKPPHRAIQNWWRPFLLMIDTVLGIFIRKRHLTKAGFTSIQVAKRYSSKKLTNTFMYKPTYLSTTLNRVALHIKANHSTL